MQYPPVNFRLLRHLLTVASVEDEVGARRCLRDIATQLNLYAPSNNRDTLAALVELAIQHPQTMRYAVQKALDDWLTSQATETEQAAMHAGIKRQVVGQKGNANKQANAADRLEEWQEEADKIWKRQPKLSKKAVGLRVAESCGGRADYIRQKIKKPEK